MTSPFLAVNSSEWIASNASAFAIADAFPVSPGHSLVIPRRLFATWWEATPDERGDLLALVDQVKLILDQRLAPDGYNVGFNSGPAAGQTVDHLHLHVIPRYSGDVPDPRGGVRHVIPGRGNYLAKSDRDRAATVVELSEGRERLLEHELTACLQNRAFDRVDFVVSFIMKSGFRRVKAHLEDALRRGATARVLTTDYLQITDADALAELYDMADASHERLAVKVFHDPATSFHPKAYLFWSSAGTVARGFVGSNNLSASGIGGGVEWSLAVDDVGPMIGSFVALWDDERSAPLTREWLKRYRSRPRPRVVAAEAADVVLEAPAQPAQPRPIQRAALSALEQTRIDGYRAGLVVMATGLGKTWLAAFDSTRPEFRRVLFVAHREEILRQSRDVYRRVRPDGDLGLFYGPEKTPHADVVFATVQTLAGRLEDFATDAFDYIVVDEFHHAAAGSYRRLLAHFAPAFLLGLTATPDRMDGADLLALCADNLVFECGLVEGVEQGELSPFRYLGIRDPVDFAPIPWRNGRFDPEALSEAVATHERAERAFEEWQNEGGGRTLGFCVSIAHAEFMARFFSERDVPAVAVHSGAASAPRAQAVEDLRSGRLQAIFTVDLFNEGVDIPEVETVLMLRPTESPVVFLQQLGRGLRKSADKDALRVVDFIGNHRSFLLKPRTLLALGQESTPSTTRTLKALREGDFELPAGCSVDYPLDVIELFELLARGSRGRGMRNELIDYVRSVVDESGVRPTATQTYRAGFNPASARDRGGWFALLNEMDVLSDHERAVAGSPAGEFLAAVESEAYTKSYKLVTLLALLQDSSLRSGAPITQVAWTSHRIVASDPRLVADVVSNERPNPAAVPEDEWRSFWRKWPIAAWAGELRGQPGRWFRIQGERLVPTFSVPAELGDAFDAMAAEVVDYRLLRYLFTKGATDAGEMRCRVGQTNGRPLVWLDRKRYPGLPEGQDVPFVADGLAYRGNFVKIALNVARRDGVEGNALHGLLRGWFGDVAGMPGTNHEVVLRADGDVWRMDPVKPAAPTSAVTDVS